MCVLLLYHTLTIFVIKVVVNFQMALKSILQFSWFLIWFWWHLFEYLKQNLYGAWRTMNLFQLICIISNEYLTCVAFTEQEMALSCYFGIKSSINLIASHCWPLGKFASRLCTRYGTHWRRHNSAGGLLWSPPQKYIVQTAQRKDKCRCLMLRSPLLSQINDIQITARNVNIYCGTRGRKKFGCRAGYMHK